MESGQKQPGRDGGGRGVWLRNLRSTESKVSQSNARDVGLRVWGPAAAAWRGWGAWSHSSSRGGLGEHRGYGPTLTATGRPAAGVTCVPSSAHLAPSAETPSVYFSAHAL